MRQFRYYLLCLTILASMTIPRAGTKFGDVPVTLPILLYLFLLGLFLLRPLSAARVTISSGDRYVDVVTWSAIAFMTLGLVSITIGMMRGALATRMLVEGVALLGFVPAFFVIRSHIRTPAAFATVISLIGISLAVTCVYGVCQRIFGHYRVMIPGITIAYSDALSPDAFSLKNNVTAVGLKVVSTFQNGNLFGYYLALLLPIPATLYHRSRGARKHLHGLFLALVLISLLLTLSRGAIVSGVISLAVLGILLRGSLTLRIVGLLLGGIGGLLVYVLGLGERLLRIDTTLGGRTSLYDQLSVLYGRLHPLDLISAAFLGAGIGGTINRGLFSIRRIEGSLVIVGMTMGLPGVIALVGVIVGVFLCAWRWCRPVDSFEAQMGCALAAGIVGSSAQLAIDSVMFLPPTSMNLWTVAALAIVACSIVRERAGSAA